MTPLAVSRRAFDGEPGWPAAPGQRPVFLIDAANGLEGSGAVLDRLDGADGEAGRGSEEGEGAVGMVDAGAREPRGVIDDVVLYQSVLAASGSRYRALARIPLASRT